MTMHWAKVWVATVGLALVAFGVASCGEDNGQASGSGDETTSVKVGFFEAVDNVYLWRAQDAGYFEDEGLDVELSPMTGGAAVIPAVVGGSLDFGTSEPFSLLQARAEGLDVKYVLFHRFDTRKAPDLFVMAKDSEIQGPDDLTGKTLTTNLLKNMVHLAGQEWLRNAGVDPDGVKFIEVPFPDVNQALDTGAADAVISLEPFKAIGESQGFRVIGRPIDGFRTEPNQAVAIGGLLTSGEFAQEQPDVVDGMVAASRRAFADLEDPKVMRETLAAHMDISPDVLADVIPIDFDNPAYQQPLSADLLEVWKEAGVRNGLLPADLDLEQAVVGTE